MRTIKESAESIACSVWERGGEESGIEEAIDKAFADDREDERLLAHRFAKEWFDAVGRQEEGTRRAEQAARDAAYQRAREAFQSCEYVDETEGSVALEMDMGDWAALREYFKGGE